MSSSGWVPALELDEVVLLDSASREALRLPRVAAAVSARSLLAFELRFEQLLIDGAQLEVRRDAGGRLHVAGLELAGNAADGGSALADWFFEQHEFVIRHGRLRWVDQQRGAPPLELSEVDLVIRNGLRTHALRLDATPPAAWGDRFSLRGRFSQSLFSRAGDWRGWSGTLHAALPRADVAELRHHLDLPFKLSAGDGALRAWVDVAQGRLRGITADLALREVALRLAPALQTLAFERVEGRLIAQDDEDRLHVAAQGLRFVSGEGFEWPASGIDLTLRKAGGGTGFVSGEFAADRLDLGVMAGVAERLPVGEALRTLLAGLAPRGQVQGLSARWDGPLDAPTRYQVKARLDGVSIEAGAAPATPDGHVGIGRPGWRKASLDFEASERGGQGRLNLDGGALVFPGVLTTPEVALDKFDALLVWRIDRAREAAAPPRVSLEVRKARFANPDAEGEFEASWHTGQGSAAAHGAGARFPGVLDLGGRLTRGRAAAAARYLPQALGATALQYVERSVLDGRIASASFKVKGDLWDFPFHRSAPGGGEFRIAAKVADVRLAYVPAEPGRPAGDPAWPAATRVAGELVFDRAAMEIREASGRILGVDLSRVNGGIRNLLARPELRIEGQARGPLADLLRYVNLTPVGEWTGRVLAGATASGPADLSLALALPLDDLARSQVQGSVQLAGNELRLRPDVPPMTNARGRVEFSQKGVTIVGGSARLLGGDASFEGGTQADGSLRFSGQGVASAEGLRRAVELGRLARLGSVASGQTSYRLQLGFVRGASEFTLTSPLTGLALDLPAPLRKSAEVALPLRLQSTLLAEEPGAPLRDQLRIELGTLVQAQYVRELSRDAPQVLRGGIGVMDAAPQPSAGVAASLRLPSLDVDAWQAAAERLLGANALAALGADGAPAPGGRAGNVDAGYLPSVVALRAQSLLAGSRRLTQLVLGLSRDGGDGAWRATLDAEQLAGYVELRLPRGPASPGRVYARLSRLTVPPAETESVTQLLEQAPTSVPAMDIVVDDFDLRGKKLGRVEIEAVNRGAREGGRESGRDGGSEWRLLRFAVTNPEASLLATGQWSAAGGGRRRMQLDFNLDLADSGGLLERLGMGRTLKGGKGRLQGRVSWAGSPLALHVPSLDGQMNLQLDAGQFLKAGPGVGRLLGVLSLQALPRRLALDFRDVFQEGFAFDNVTGDVSVRDGVASTNNLRMRGVQAAVLMEGSADIEHETQDLRVVVVPEINAGTASLAYAAINPAIGLGTFLAQMFLRRPLMAAGTREFHVSGPWSDPKVERVERAPGAPLPDLDPPAAAASSPPRTP